MPSIIDLALPPFGLCLGLCALLALMVLLIGLRAEDRSLGQWMTDAIWFRNLFCTATTAVIIWALYQGLLYMFALSWALGMLACVLLTTASLIAAAVLDHQARH